MSDQLALTEPQLAACRRDHAYLERIVRRKGILAFDPESPAGKEIYDLFDALAQASNPKRDPAIRLQGVELAVESIVIRRSIVSQLLQLGKFNLKPTKAGGARRSAFGAALAAWNTCAAQMERACRIMGVEGYAQIEAVIENPDDLKALLKRRAEKIQDAEFRPVGEASSTTEAAPEPPADPEASSPASATSEVPSADEDAPSATPDPPVSLTEALRRGIAPALPADQAPGQSTPPGTQTATLLPDAPTSDSPATPAD